ncbi:kinase-like domain-containing protein, partial [Mycena rebaudengoi]
QRFIQEAKILRSLDHAHIIPLLGVLDSRSRLCIVLPFMENGQLDKFLSTQPDIPRVPLIRQLVESLVYLRRRDVVHGDLKASNILVDASGQIRIADFGSAHIQPERITSRWILHTLRVASGTCRWMAPELLLPHRFGFTHALPTFESDIFAFAMVLYEAFPFPELRNGIAANLAIVAGTRPPRPPTMPDIVWKIANGCWRSDPNSRPSILSVII